MATMSTTLQIYNSMSQTKQPFTPQEAGKVKMYVCGPTVYDYIHIGNARPAIFFDVVRRYLEYCGYEVNYVVNFTDVDDKLIKKASELGVTVPEVATRFIAAYHDNVTSLGIRPATTNPRVTDHIPHIVTFITQLIEDGFAYESGGDVYFRTAKFADYGKLSHQNLEELRLGIRIEVDARKESGTDFVLWKAAKEGEIYWESPFGRGRPGWHIECSAMAREYLGDTLDIHGGGHDLQFPHHECEIAQSEACTGAPLANYWMHNGYINIDNQKMSKSLGNGITVEALLRTLSASTIRYFMLSSHYRNPLNFSEETIEQARNSVERIANAYFNLQHRLTVAGTQANENLVDLQQQIDGALDSFMDAMNDDFTTPDAITALFELVTIANQYLQRPVVTRDGVARLLAALEQLDRVLGLLPQQRAAEEDAEIDALIAARTEARAAKNWARADEIRDELNDRGIILEDTPQGIRWKRR